MDTNNSIRVPSLFVNVSSRINITKNISELRNLSGLDEQFYGLVSNEQLQQARYVLFYYVLPIVALSGIIGNTVSLSVLRVSKQGHAFKVYLIALTTVDIFLLLTALIRCIFIVVCRYPNILYPALMIYGDYYLGLLFGSCLQRMSASLISIISLERFVAVVFPFKVKTIPIEKHPLKTLGVVILATFLLQVPTIILIGVKESLDPSNNSTLYTFALREQTSTSNLLRKVYLITLAVVYMFIPFVIVACSTITVIIRLKLNSNKNKFTISNLKGSRDREAMMTVTLIGMAAIFTICYVPAMCIFLLPVVDKDFYTRENLFVAISVDVNVLCLCLNSATDFIIYFFASRHFRSMFYKQYLRCLFTRRPTMSRITSTTIPTPYQETLDGAPYTMPYHMESRDEVSTDITEM